MTNLGFLRFADCDTSCLIGVAIAFALFIGVLSSTLFSTEQVFDYEGQKTSEVSSSSATSKLRAIIGFELYLSCDAAEPPRKKNTPKKQAEAEAEQPIVEAPKRGRSKTPTKRTPKKAAAAEAAPASAEKAAEAPAKKERSRTPAKERTKSPARPRGKSPKKGAAADIGAFLSPDGRRSNRLKNHEPRSFD